MEMEFPHAVDLSQAQRDRIQELQDEIEEIWTKKGDYQIDDEAWRTMPLFMENVSEKDMVENESCAALGNVLYEEQDPADVAHNRKEAGNRMLKLALNPGQVNPKNLARSAANFYTEGLATRCEDKTLTVQLYSNRSQAHFILENFGHGLEDAMRCVVIDRSYTKGYYRAAKCAERIRKFELVRSMVAKGLATDPPPIEAVVAEFNAVLARVDVAEQRQQEVENAKRRKARAAAADSNNLARRITKEAGIAVGPKAEVSSDQWAQMGGARPFFDDDGMLHVPLLLLYDEYSQSDFLHDVPLDCCAADCLADMIPFPWDDRGRYRTFDDMVLFFKVDDGIKMPEHYAVPLDMPLQEVFKHTKYVMPGLVPTLHIVPRGSELAKQFGVN